MRIANNIMAMNTHRSYTANNEAVQKSAEKLSSGYRINRAGDDAAGLAISEKMRSQIRGLNMATKNSQDAVSLIQTAEGALQEVHSMLQRMNELAVQSATGTNETFDRTQIAKEFEQPKREINDISEQTTFNNMNILDGSLSAQGLQRSAYTSGIYTQFETVDSEASAGGIKQKTITEGTPFVKGYSATFTVDLSAAKIEDDGVDVEIKIGGQTLSSGTQLDSDATAADIAAEFDTKTVEIDGVTYTATADGTKLNFAIANDADFKDISAESLSKLTVEGGTDIAGVAAKVSGVAEGKANVDATIAESSFVFDWEAAKSGDQFKIGNDTFTFYNSDTDAADAIPNPPTAFDIDLAKVTSAADLADAIDGNATDVTVTAQGNTVKIVYNGNAGGSIDDNNTAGSYGPKGNAFVKLDSMPVNKAEEGVTTFELDTSKMKAGDVISWKNDDGTTYEYTVTDKTTAKDIATAFGVDIDGNTWKVEGRFDASDRIGFKAADDFKEYDVMKIQVGALEGEQLSIRIGAMNTAGLGLDGFGIYTQESAGEAITATRAAINEVSDQRALLGAMQNRMTHKIANLKVSVENLQASESRIRDVDIASEMTEFTKSNILSQAATAMLAQANSAPQNVLSLLR